MPVCSFALHGATLCDARSPVPELELGLSDQVLIPLCEAQSVEARIPGVQHMRPRL